MLPNAAATEFSAAIIGKLRSVLVSVMVGCAVVQMGMGRSVLFRGLGLETRLVSPPQSIKMPPDESQGSSAPGLRDVSSAASSAKVVSRSRFAEWCVERVACRQCRTPLWRGCCARITAGTPSAIARTA